MISSRLLVEAIELVRDRVTVYRSHARLFYFEILLTIHRCPDCDGKMSMTGPSQCQCQCGTILDPTIQFQRSGCCDALLGRRRCHYACTHCGRTVASKFLFDEKLFDHLYFCEKISESRERKRRQKEELRCLLAASRSNELMITDIPEIAVVHGLSMALDEFVGATALADMADFISTDEFRMEDYRQMILSWLDDCTVRFGALPAIGEDPRLDRVRRFITLLFMEQDREVWLEQRGDEILVMRYEAHIEG